MKDLVIVGVGGFARETYVNALNSIGYGSEYTVKGFLDGTIKMSDEEYLKLPLPVLGNVENYNPSEKDIFIVAVGDSKIREKLVELLDRKNVNYATIVNKAAVVAPSAKLGKGVIVSMGCCVGPNVQIEDYVLLNLYVTLGHDVQIGKYSSIMSHVDLTAWVKVGKFAYFGSGSRALPHARIGDNASIAAGSLVLNYVRKDTKVFGVPAKKYEM